MNFTTGFWLSSWHRSPGSHADNSDYQNGWKLAEELGTNPRYLSAVINSRFGMNYSSLVNEFRVRDAANMLTDKRYLDLTMDEIGRKAGFANRQSFYAAFFKEKGEAPHQYKKRLLSK